MNYYEMLDMFIFLFFVISPVGHARQVYATLLMV